MAQRSVAGVISTSRRQQRARTSIEKSALTLPRKWTKSLHAPEAVGRAVYSQRRVVATRSLPTEVGRGALVTQTLTALRNVRPTYSSVLLGMAHWPVLERSAALGALQARGEAIEAELARLGNIQIDQQPLPDSVEALFDFSLGQLRAEAEWITGTLDHMKRKPWLT